MAYANPSSPVAVTATATQIFSVNRAAGSGPAPVLIQNRDVANSVAVGGPAVTYTSGILIPPGATLPLQVSDTGAVLYGICNTGLTASVTVLTGGI